MGNKYWSPYQETAREIWEGGGFKNYVPDNLNKWLERETKRSIVGYAPPGHDWIPGDYYFHLNFVHGEIYDEIAKIKFIDQFPYRESDHELHCFLDKCEKDKVGALVLKGRRARFTTTIASKFLCRWSFYPGVTLGVGSYGGEYVAKVKSMIDTARSRIPEYFSYSTLTDSDKLLEQGQKLSSTTGSKKEGEFSKIYYRNFGGAKLNTGAFRSLSLQMLLIDEIGENPYLFECIKASEECWKEGGEWYGIPILGGTSNLMSNQSKDLTQLIREPEKRRFRVHVIPRQKFYYLLGHNFVDYEKGIASPDQQEAARKYIVAEGERLSKFDNKTDYYVHLQENPTCIEDMLMGNAKSLILPLELINNQIKVLNDYDSLKNNIRKWDLHWKNGFYNPKNQQVEWDTTTENGEYHVLEMPDGEYKNQDIIGIDTYYRSGAPNSDSIGVAYVFRRENYNDSSKLSNAPIVEYAARYPTNERFYDGCLKLAVAYSHPGNPCKMLSEFDATFLMWIEKALAFLYLKKKPTAISGQFSNSGNAYMLAMSGQAKHAGTKLMSDYFNSSIQNIGFERLLDDARAFGIRNTDYCSAFLVTLIHNLDVQDKPVEKVGKKQKEDFFPSFEYSEGGILIPNASLMKDTSYMDFLDQ